MTIRINSLSKMVTLLAVASLAGCSSTGNFFTPDRVDYKSASSKKDVAPTLDVPPDLSQISRDNRYSIPDNGGTGTLTASGFNAKNAGTSVATQSTLPATTAINSLENMHIERDGSQRWLLVKTSPDALWPKLKDFWQENGFVINQDLQVTGVMETDWAENRAKIPQDIIRKTIGYVFDSLYSTGERDKFRTRLERRDDGSTEIYISHHGVEEVLTGAQKDGTIWTARANDPGLEAIFLSKLMVRLGATPEKAKELVANPVELPSKAKLIKNAEGVSQVNIDETFDRAWRRVGLALDRVNFTVEDRDRIKGLYFVRYVDQDADTSKDGFFSRIFSSDKDKDAKRYRILVKSDGSASFITVQNNDGGAENSKASEKILGLILEQLK